MTLKMAPQFAQLRERLRHVAWFSSVGHSTPLTLPFAHRFINDGATAKNEIERDEWEEWTLERRNDLTSFLSSRFRSRYNGQWNRVADEAVKVLADDVEPMYLPLLARVLFASKIAINAVQWDLLAALMEAAYADCHPPLFFTHLIVVYEAGHLPVGWDAGGEGSLLVY